MSDDWPVAPADSVPLLTTDQMREVDRIMVQDLGIDLVRMMEHAGRLLAEVTRSSVGWAEEVPVTVLAGGGNNGGGGLVAARNLHNWGSSVTVVLDRSPDDVGGVPGDQLAVLRRLECAVVEDPPAESAGIVDALIGYGIQGDPRGRAAELIRWVNDQPVQVVSLDGPSGLDLTTGLPGDPCVRADATMTLGLPKGGLLAATAREVVGELLLADIGVPPEVYERLGLGLVRPFSSSTILRVELPADG